MEQTIHLAITELKRALIGADDRDKRIDLRCAIASLELALTAPDEINEREHYLLSAHFHTAQAMGV